MEDIDTVWREFGKHSEAGKLLYELYGVKYKPKVNYPKLKVKSKEEQEKEKREKEEETMRKRAQSTNRIATINYPDMNKKKVYNIAKVDLIPKRKHENVIKKEMEALKKNAEPPKQNISNRKAQIENLQQKFQFSANTNLPKAARLPALKDLANVELPLENKEVPKRKVKVDRQTELQSLYDSIMKEIDERYEHIEKLKKLGKKDSEAAILSDIKDRINELRKIEKLMNKAD